MTVWSKVVARACASCDTPSVFSWMKYAILAATASSSTMAHLQFHPPPSSESTFWSLNWCFQIKTIPCPLERVQHVPLTLKQTGSKQYKEHVCSNKGFLPKSSAGMASDLGEGPKRERAGGGGCDGGVVWPVVGKVVHHRSRVVDNSFPDAATRIVGWSYYFDVRLLLGALLKFISISGPFELPGVVECGQALVRLHIKKAEM